MTNTQTYLDTTLLNDMVIDKYIKVQKHPGQDLFIYNYTAKAQFEGIWNECTLNCRGLIMNKAGDIIARPLPKFFNLGEQENQYIPNEPFEVYEKMDGSLGILYWLEGQPHMASRGSFTSEQAKKAEQMLYGKYRSAISKLNPNVTYLFEIIYPANRIVVDYGRDEKLVLLAMIETKTGEELELEDIGFPIVKRYDRLNDLYTLKSEEVDNKEGFVVKFKSGYRLKIKFEEYVRIHRIVTQVSSINIWEYLKTGQPMNDLLERVPDEFYNWVKSTKTELEQAFAKIEAQAKADFKVLESRKATALYFQECKYPQVLFAMLDGKDYSERIWKMLRPEYERPFKELM